MPPYFVAAENPFASRYVRPGSLPYFFSTKSNVKKLLQRLESSRWRGVIIGPHGNGKSTLLATLANELSQRGLDLQWIPQRIGGWDPPPPWVPPSTGSPRRVLMIDGFDDFSLWRRSLMRFWCRQREWGIVATSHVPVGLPVLHRTSSTLSTAIRVATHLAGSGFANDHRHAIQDAFRRHQGNLREVLFDLYDLYERNDRQCRTDRELQLAPL